MILTLYLLLLLFTLIFFVLGLYLNNPVLSIVGCGFLFIMGSTLMTGIEIQSGLTITDTETGALVDYRYENYSNHTFGFFIVLTGFAGLLLTFLDMWRARR